MSRRDELWSKVRKGGTRSGYYKYARSWPVRYWASCYHNYVHSYQTTYHHRTAL